MKRFIVALTFSTIVCSPAVLASHMASTSIATGSNGSINTESAVPLDAGSWSFGMRYEEQRFDRLGDDTLLGLVEADPNADLHSIKAVKTTLFGIAFGLNDKLTLGLSLPVVERTDIRAPHFDAVNNEFEIEREGDSKGIGDLKLYGLWRFAQGDSHSTSVLFGANTPTGKDDDTSPDGEVYEQEFQPGSGAWVPMIGIAHSRDFGRFSLDASTSLNLSSKGSQQTDLGDWVTYNAGLSYLLGSDSALEWHLVTEVNGLWRDNLTEDGEKERNSGGTWINISPGIVVRTDKWSVFVNVAVPLVSDPGGDQDDQDYRFQVGFQFGL